MMELAEIAEKSGVSIEHARRALYQSDEVVFLRRGIASRVGSVVHLAVFPIGLGGRSVLRECEALLLRWFQNTPVLHAPVAHENIRALRIAKALGFKEYTRNTTHVWLLRERDHHE